MFSSSAIDFLSLRFEDNVNTRTIYFYFDYKRQQTATDFVSCLLHQALRFLPSIPKDFEEFYDARRERSSPEFADFERLKKFFSDATRNFGLVIIVLDALDECSESVRPTVLEFLNEWLSSNKIKVVATSRPHQDGQILSRFGGRGTTQVWIQAGEYDVKQYIADRLKDTYFDDQLKEEIVNRIGVGIQGMYVDAFINFL